MNTDRHITLAALLMLPVTGLSADDLSYPIVATGQTLELQSEPNTRTLMLFVISAL
jgi:hypothetical protein